MFNISMSFTYLIAFIFIFTHFMCIKCDCDMKEFLQSKIVPKIIPSMPPKALEVSYSHASVDCGQNLNLTQTVTAPEIVCDDVSDQDLYTLIMIDPDAPQPDNPFLSNYLHWLMVNNPGCSTKEGKTLADYMAPSPPPISDPHRYVLFVYSQSSKIDNQPTYNLKRTKFDIQEVVKNLKLKDMKAANFFYASSKPHLR